MSEVRDGEVRRIEKEFLGGDGVKDFLMDKRFVQLLVDDPINMPNILLRTCKSLDFTGGNKEV